MGFMQIFELVSGLFGGKDKLGGLIKEIITKDMIEKLIEKTSKEDIELLFIMAITLKSEDQQLQKQGLDLIGKIALKQENKTVVITDNGDCG